MISGYPEVFFEDDVGGAFLGNEQSARRETESGDIEGYVVPYLREEFLRGYLAYLARAHPDKEQYQKIPEVVERVITPLFAQDSTSYNIFTFGQIPRYIARGTDDDYWRIAAHRIESGEKWDPDLDLMADGVSIEKLSEQLMASFSVKETNPDEVFPERRKYTFLLDGFEIQVSVGKVPTADIHNMVISLVDVNASRRIFHVDLSEFTHDPQIIIREKRKGETFDWQDLVYATLSPREGHIHYYMSKESKEVMFSPTPVVTRSTNKATILETMLRAIRMGVQLPLEGGGTVPDRVDFGRFAPFFTSDSILRLHALILLARDSGESISAANLKLIQGEFRRCFEIDPYLAAASLRDTSTSRLIPGLSHLTPIDWDNILRSDQFALELDSDRRLVRREKRNWDYVKRQRRMYKTADASRRRTDGHDRFLRALKELRLVEFRADSSDEMFAQLWEPLPRIKRGEVSEELKPGEQISPDAQTVKVGALSLFGNFETASPEDLLRAASLLQQLAREAQPWEERLAHAKRVFRAYAKGTMVETQLDDPYYSDDMQSMALVYGLLEQYGYLTPRLLETLYNAVKLDGLVKSKFGDVFYTLKTLGITHVYTLQRVDRHGRTVPLEYYLLRTSAPSPLAEVLNTTGFMRYLETTSNAPVLHTVLTLKEYFKISTVEALLSLRTEDVKIMKVMMYRDGYGDEVAESSAAAILEFIRVYTEYLMGEQESM